MNILVVGRRHPESFAVHIADTLNYIGYNALIFDPIFEISLSKNPFQQKLQKVRANLFSLYLQTNYGRESHFNKFKKFLEGKKVDLVISCHDFLTPAQVQWVKKHYLSKVVLWFPDAISNFGKAMFLDSDYDALFFKEPFVVEVLKNEYNKNAYYLPECCNPFKHNKINVTKDDLMTYGCELTTAGNMHTARSAFFKNLVEYDVKIWGTSAPSWLDARSVKHMIQNHFVINEEKSKAFACSKIVINTMHPTEIYGANVRLFEIAATGSFQLCNYRSALDDLYEIDEELIVFKTLDEFHEKARFYLKNESLRKQIGEKAYIRTMKDHTYEKRLNLMLKLLNEC